VTRSKFADWCKAKTRGKPGDPAVKTDPAESGWFARALLAPAWGPYPALYSDPLPVVEWVETWYQGDIVDAAPTRACVVRFADGTQQTLSSSIVEVYQGSGG
jgi:hypothetical protein